VKHLRRAGAGVASIVTILALASSALADTTITASVGPIAIPVVPVDICVVQTDLPGGIAECQTTPPVLTVALTVVVHVATPDPNITPPTISPIPCPGGTQGVALQVNTGGSEAGVGGFVTVTLVVNGNVVTQTIPIGQVIAGPDQTLTVYACAGAQPGVPLPPLPV
jgi:hypothetical protein